MALLGLAADVSQNAAVGVQDLAVHKVGSVACKEHAGTHHVVRLTPAACGGLSGDELVEGVAAAVRLHLPQRCGLGSGDVAGAHAVASHASDFVNGQILYADGGILAYIGRQPK